MMFRSRFIWAVVPPTIRAIGRLFFSLEVEHESPLPAPPYVVAANHYSHFDSPAIAAALDVPIRYLALEDMFGVNRLLDWLAAGTGAISTPRHRLPIAAVRTALAALEGDDVVGLFPEATRVSHWGTLPPKRGAAWLAVRTGVPLLPVAVVGTGQAFGLDNRVRRAPIRVVVGTAIEPGRHDVEVLTATWADWVTSQIAKHPGSEVPGPPRAHHRF